MSTSLTKNWRLTRSKSVVYICLAALLLILTTYQATPQEHANEFVVISVDSNEIECVEASDCSELAVSDFSISRYEVTIGEWNDCAAHGYCEDLGEDLLPSDAPIQVSSLESIFPFLEWINRDGSNFRLPTLNEYAVVMADDGVFWFDQSDCNKDVWGWVLCDVDGVKSVGSGSPNRYGIYNLHGNAAEWIWPNEYEKCSRETNRYLNLSYSSKRHSGLETVGVACDGLRRGVGFRLVQTSI